MDSPIFGSQKSYQNPKINKISQFSTNATQFHSGDFYLSSKNNTAQGNPQISKQIKMAFALLVLQKNIKTLFYKISKCVNRKKYQSFQQIKTASDRFPSIHHKQMKKNHAIQFQAVNNPEKKPFATLCIAKANRKIEKIYQILDNYRLKKVLKSWNRILINSEKYTMIGNQKRISQYSDPDSIHLGLCSKIQQQKRLNSKKHAKDMKQNSLLNNTVSEYDNQNQKLVQEIINEEMNLQKFEQQLNHILSNHEARFTQPSERDTCSQNAISQNSYDNKQEGNYKQGTKNVNGKKK